MDSKNPPLADQSTSSVIRWSTEEWRRLAEAWAADEALHPALSQEVRWNKLVAAVFPPERQRPFPRANVYAKVPPMSGMLAELKASLNQTIDNLHNQADLVAEPTPESTSLVKEDDHKRRRFRWTNEEKAAFARAFAEVECEDPSLTKPEQAKRAQQRLLAAGKLKPERLRMSKGMTFIYGLKREIDGERARLAQQGEKRLQALELASSQRATVTHPVVSESAARTHTPSLTSTPGLANPPAPSLADLGSALLTRFFEHPAVQSGLRQIVEPLLRQVVRDIVQDVVTEIARTTFAQAIYDLLGGPSSEASTKPSQHPNSPPETSAATTVKKRVLVVGLLGQQQRDIAARYGADFDFRFLDKDVATQRLEQHARNSDITIAMVSFISHQTEHHLRKAAKDYRRCNGTASDLGRILQGILSTA